MKVASLILVTLASIFSLQVMAADPVPSCMVNGANLPVNNQQVLNWKHTTANQFLARAHVQGTITQVYPDRNGHRHFAIRLDEVKSDTLEIVFNDAFGKVVDLRVGLTVEACGDYITSEAATSQYPASPDGAILHWVHANPKGQGHPSGYL